MLKAHQAFSAAYAAELAQAGVKPGPQSALRAAATACRAQLLERWAVTQAEDAARGADAPVRRVHYLSM